MTEPTSIKYEYLRLELTGRDLRTMLDPVLAHAVTSPDPFFIPMPYVQIEISGGVLYLFATDKYTLGVTRHQLSEDPGTIALTVAADCLRMMLRTIKARDEVRLDITRDAVTVHHQETPIEFRLPATGDVVIDWRKLIRTALTKPTNHGDLPVKPAYLARFCAATRSDQPLHIHATDRVAVMTCGENFLGAFAPLRFEQPTNAFTGWLPDLTSTTFADWLPDITSTSPAWAAA